MASEITVLPKISDIQLLFVKLYAQTPIVSYCTERVQVSLDAGHKWLRQKKIKVHLRHWQEKLCPKCPFTADDVASEAARIGFYDIKNAIPSAKFDNNSKEVLIKLADWDKVDGRVVKSVKHDIKEGCEVLRLTFHDKIAALRLLQDHLKGGDPEKHVHVHLTAEDLAKRDIHGAAAAYQQLLD